MFGVPVCVCVIACSSNVCVCDTDISDLKSLNKARCENCSLCLTFLNIEVEVVVCALILAGVGGW